VAQQGSPPGRSRMPAGRSVRSGGSGRKARSGRPDSGPGQDRRPRRSDRPDRADRQPWQSDPFPADTDPDLPPWAGPGIYASRPGRRELRPPEAEPDEPPGEGGGRRRRGRAAAARLRRSRRKVLVRGAAAVIVAVAVAVGLLVHYRQKPAPVSDFITALQAGEFRSVPSACHAVGPATLGQFLPGSRKILQSIASSTQSQCSFTVDAKPLFRVLEVTTQAFQPRVLATGNGSATYNAIYSYFQLENGLASPPKKTPLPKARISQLAGLGQAGLSALQVPRAGGTRMDVVTVLVRDRNVLITIALQGQASGDGYGPVSVTQLRTGALAVARQVLAGVAAGPTVSG
jgi:hypothetical protein